jgi:hypothetical protein
MVEPNARVRRHKAKQREARMRRGFALFVIALTMTTACARPGAAQPNADDTADIYVAVLRRYLASPSENSFTAGSLRLVFVLDRADPAAADPMRRGEATGERFSTSDRQKMTASLADLGNVSFVGTRDEVLVNAEGCAQVRDGGILITLAPPAGDGDQVTVGINGFVACLGATWLTYVVKRDASGWTVTGTTGSRAIA